MGKSLDKVDTAADRNEQWNPQSRNIKLLKLPDGSLNKTKKKYIKQFIVVSILKKGKRRILKENLNGEVMQLLVSNLQVGKCWS